MKGREITMPQNDELWKARSRIVRKGVVIMRQSSKVVNVKRGLS